MSSKKKPKVVVERSVAEKLEIVQARHQGVGIKPPAAAFALRLLHGGVLLPQA